MALKDDNINLYVNIGTNGAQESIRKLSEANRELEKTNKATRLEMEKLKAQGCENSDEFRQLNTALKSNSATIAENVRQIKEQENSISLNGLTMKQLRENAKDLQTQLDRTVQSADPQGYADLQKQLEATRGRMGELKTSGQSLAGQLQSIPGPAGGVVQGVMGINSAFKILLANPVMAIIAAIVAVFMALYNALKSSEDATNKLNAILAPFGAIMDAILFVVQKCVGAILDFVGAIVNGLMKALESLPFVGDKFKQLNDYAKEAIELEKAKQALEKKQRDTLLENAEAELKVSKLRTEAKQKDKFTAQERIAMVEEAVKLEKEMADKQIANAREKLRIAEAEAARAENTTETERNLAELRAASFQAEKTYYDRTRELSEQMNSARNEMVAEEKKRQEDLKKQHREALDNQLKTVDASIAAEKAKLMQARLDKEISEKELAQKLETLELESLDRKLQIHGLDKEKRIELEQAVLEARLNMQRELEKTTEEQAKKTTELLEKLRLSALSKDEQELDSIRKKHTEEEKLLAEALEKKLITEAEYQLRLAAQQDEMQDEIDKKRQEQNETKAAGEIAKKDQEFEQEKVKLMERYANEEITQEEYNQLMLELEQNFLDQKLRISGLSEEQITKLKEQQLNKQISTQEKALKKQSDLTKKYTDIAAGAAGKFGEILGGLAAGAEMTAEEMQYQMVMLALDTLKQIVLMAATQAMANMIGQLGPIWGPIAGAAATGLIMGAFEALKSKIKKPSAKNKGEGDTSVTSRLEVKQYADGKYNVIGSDDGKTYRNVPYIGQPQTGIIKNPALIAEQGEELIISSPDMQLLKKHANYPCIVSAINDVKAGTVPQHAHGNYASLSADPLTPSPDSRTGEIMEQLLLCLADLKTNGIKSYVGLDQLDAQRKLRDESRALGSLNNVK